MSLTSSSVLTDARTRVLAIVFLAFALTHAATAALVLLGASFAVWAFALPMKEEYHALASGWRVLLLPMKTYAALILLGLCATLSRRTGASHGATTSSSYVAH